MKQKITINAGEEWIVTMCHGVACGRTLLVAPILPEMLDDRGVVTIDFAPQKLKCPHCHNESVYQKAELKRGKAQRFQ